MTTNCDDWIYQTNIKHGKVDDRGNPLDLTNVRTNTTARDHADSLEALAEHAHRIGAALAKFRAAETLSERFEVEAAQESEDRRQYDNQYAGHTPAPQPRRPEDLRVGEKMPCPVNPRAQHEHRTGMKNGKSWAAVFCSNKPTECAPVWL